MRRFLLSTSNIFLIVFAAASFLGCSASHGQSAPITASGPTTFSSNQNGADFGQVAAVPDNSDVVSGYEREAGPQMHLRVSRAYCDKRTGSAQSPSDQTKYFCVPDAVTIDDAHPPSSTPNKDFVIAPYAFGMNIDYPSGIEINSVWLGAHYNHSRCAANETNWLNLDSCQEGGQLFVEDNWDAGGIFATGYAVLSNGTSGSVITSQSFSLIASDTYQHTSHGDLLFAVRNPDDSVRFQFGVSGVGGADDPTAYKNFTRARIDSTGKGFFDGGTQVGGADFAESVTAAGDRMQYEPGDVLVISTDSDRQFSLSHDPYSTLAAGIYSTKPGVIGSAFRSEDPKLAAQVPLALVGIVPCKVTDENGPISRGDLLVTSSTSGYAMRGTDAARLPGAVVGKALQPFASGKGQIEVLVTLR